MPGAGDTMRESLLPLATVVTPNLDEAEQLTGIKAADEDAMLAVARAIKELGPRWVLVKGGHLAGDPVDVLFDGTRTWRFGGRRKGGRVVDRDGHIGLQLDLPGGHHLLACP